ncbi:MAG: hypothetical protein RL077_4326 [Verrucomicrobiota bacterium]
MVCFLALALWRALAPWMQLKELDTCARRLVNRMAGIKSVDGIVPVHRAEIATELRRRLVTTPVRATGQRLAHRGRRLPKGTRDIS